MSSYLRKAVSNGIPEEQALIRRWWHECHRASGRIVWEYHLSGFYADAVWFPGAKVDVGEFPGTDTARRFPLDGEEIVLCEAKGALTPELVGQALVYSQLAQQAGAEVRRTVVFARSGSEAISDAARALGLEVVLS